MSMPSSSDGNNVEDTYYNAANVNEMPPHLAQSSSGMAGVTMPPPHLMWQNPLLSTQYVHSQQQQTHFNEIIYNMHQQGAFGPPAGNQETYSVLPVGHGNFLKIYHCPETTSGGITADNSLYHQQPTLQQQFHHPQQPPYQQMSQHQHPTESQPTAATPPIYNSYELFSSTTLMPSPENPVGFDCDAPSQQQIQPQQNPLFLLNNANVQEKNAQVNSTTNMIINKLVNNWSPNLTGGTYSQFGSTVNQTSNPTTINNIDMDVPKLPSTPHQINNATSFNTSKPVQSIGNNLEISSTQTLGSKLAPPQSNSKLLESTQFAELPVINNMEVFKEVSTQNNNVSITTGGQVLSPNNSIVPEVKKRIVAEVKPMRMTYSDVLSKMNSQQTAPTQVMNVKNNVTRNGKISSSPIQTVNDRKVEMNNTRRSVINEENNVQQRTSKRSPVHVPESSKENIQTTNIGNTKSSKRVINQTNGAVNNANFQQKSAPVQAKQTSKTHANDSNSNSSNNNSKKRSNSKRSGEVDQQTENTKSTKSTSGAGAAKEKDFTGFYNVTAKNNESFRRQSKSTNHSNSYPASHNNATSNANLRKSNKNSSGYYSNSSATVSNQHQSRSRYNNSSVNSSYSYSSKRNRGSNFSSSYGSDNDDAPNPNVELAKKFLRAWFEYTLKILHWLFYLVYDIVVLGFSRVYEQLSLAYEHGFAYAQQLRKDLKQNSNKPSIWLKEYWRRFDARFKKDSRWAIWRRFYKKKLPEASTEPFKTGRLPQTGEEAMYSLLNCKGKDAYSILGVPPDSSQEQIRKHYKKIAVLVHPDKNKQAGAEEAFKVLQRAFELIGEPENRRAYDQNLAEALHEEKAWTELHDLLSQLQTKITEAANTIRCSTCGLRHPRKLTGRPHFAARECASCKIRHSAREGDIWAETSFLGLRWKYLALMEGKVYDITEWANCQKGALSHLEPNSHMVQYRIVRGAQQQQQQQQQQQHTSQNYQNSPHRHGQQYPHNTGPNSGNAKYKRDMPGDDSLHDFLDNLYSGQHPNQSNSANYSNPSRRRNRRN